MKIFLKNWIYILWATIYILITWAAFGGGIDAFMLVICIYGASIGLALSPIGEAILRLTEGARSLKTKEEKEYLQPLFDEVYENAKKAYPKLGEVELFILDKGFVNAFAMGRHTIAITKPAIETFSEDELKGIIAHEFGHIANGDTKALLLNVVGNGIFTILILILRLVMLVIAFITGATRNPFAIIMTFIVNIIFNVSVFLFIIVGEIILSINSRTNEYGADTFSYQCGFGIGLVQSLYILQKISIPSDVPLIDRIRASHPDTANRISKLELLIDEE